MHDVASALMEYNLDEKMLDVPLTLSHGTAKFPIGRFLRRKLRVLIGRNEKCPEGLPSSELDLKMSLMRKTALDFKKYPKGLSRDFAQTQEILEASEGRRIQIAAKHRRFQKKGNL